VAVREGPVDDGLTAVDGHRLDSGTVVDGRWIIEIGLEGTGRRALGVSTAW
jgi:hypothetical protein